MGGGGELGVLAKPLLLIAYIKSMLIFTLDMYYISSVSGLIGRMV